MRNEEENKIASSDLCKYVTIAKMKTITVFMNDDSQIKFLRKFSVYG